MISWMLMAHPLFGQATMETSGKVLANRLKRTITLLGKRSNKSITKMTAETKTCSVGTTTKKRMRI